MEKTITNSNGVCKTVTELTSSKDFIVHIYVYEGSTLCPVKSKEEVKVTKVNKIIEDDNYIKFYNFDSPVGYFTKPNVICYVAV